MKQGNMALQEEVDIDKEEEAPSLSDLPLTGADDHCNDRRRSLSEPADFFEFMMPDMSSSSYNFSWNDIVWPSASDINENLIFRPLTASAQKPTPPPSPPSRSFSLLLTPSSTTGVPRRVKTRRSESFNESKITTRSSCFLKSPCIRPSRSLDYCRLRRNRSTWSSQSDHINSDRFSSDQTNCASNGNGRAQPRSPPWYWLMFGPLKFPAAANIELQRNAKRRQSRPPATLFPAPEKVACDRRGWRLISVLSCKSHASVAITTPFHSYC